MSRTAVVSRNAAETQTAAVKLRWSSGPMTGRTLTIDHPSQRPHESADRRQRQQLPAAAVKILVGDALDQTHDTQVTISSRSARERSKVLAGASRAG